MSYPDLGCFAECLTLGDITPLPDPFEGSPVPSPEDVAEAYAEAQGWYDPPDPDDFIWDPPPLDE